MTERGVLEQDGAILQLNSEAHREVEEAALESACHSRANLRNCQIRELRPHPETLAVEPERIMRQALLPTWRVDLLY